MFDNSRKTLEEQVLLYYLPQNMFRFRNVGTRSAYMEAAVQANDGATYLLYFDLSNYPVTKPPVYVEQMLYTRSGEPMNKPSSTNHTLQANGRGWTQICHYQDAFWKPDESLWKVYLKCRMWIEMYRAHLRTGKPMNYYLVEHSRDTH